MDKVAIVLGTSSGIGLAIAKLLLERGFIVYGGSRSESSIEHENFVDIELDITEPNQMKAFVKEIQQDFDGVDLVINSAGICEMNSIADASSDELRNQFETNVIGSFNFLKTIGPLLLEGETHILNLLSISAHAKFENTVSFTASEHAKDSMLKIFEKEWKKYSLKFSYLYLGAVDSPLWSEYQELDRSQMLKIQDVLYCLKMIVDSPAHLKIHNLTVTHISGFIE